MGRASTVATAFALLPSVLSGHAVNPTARMKRALFSSGSEDCPAESSACLADSSCSSCLEVAEAFAESCSALYFEDDETTEEGDCDQRSQFLCCEIANGDDCENNALLAALDGAWQNGNV